LTEETAACMEYFSLLKQSQLSQEKHQVHSFSSLHHPIFQTTHAFIPQLKTKRTKRGNKTQLSCAGISEINP